MASPTPLNSTPDQESSYTSHDEKTLRHETLSEHTLAGHKETENTASSPPSTPPSEKAPEDAPADPAPDGGLQAWLVVAGSASIFFACLGFANAFGAFQEYYLTHQLRDQSPDNIAWVGSLSAFLQFAAGIVAGPLFDRYGAKIIRPAALIYIFAIMMLSLCNKYWQIMLTQGVLMGIVQGFLQVPSFAAITQYFDKKRGAAFGIVVSGSSIGGVVIPILLSKLLNDTDLGFGWSIRIVGFVIIPFIIFASVTVRARLPPRTTAFWLSDPFKNVKFMILIIALFFMYIGMFTPIFYLPTYASLYRGMNPSLAGYLLAILNGASTFGRIIPGILSDKYGKLNLFAFGGIATGVMVLCMNSATTNAALIVYAVFFGFVSGTIISGATAALALCIGDLRNVGTFIGMGFPISAIGALIGPPINGAFIHHYGGFFEMCMFSGFMCLFGGFLAFGTKALMPQGLFGRV